jgi:hypothetical protein
VFVRRENPNKNMSALNHSIAVLKSESPLQRVFEGGTMPIQGEATFARLAGSEPQPVYLIDLTRLTTAERERLITLTMETFNVPRQAVEEQLADKGFPVRASQVESATVSFSTRAFV